MRPQLGGMPRHRSSSREGLAGSASKSASDLTPDSTSISLPDGSSSDGQTTFQVNGQTHTAATVTLASDAAGYKAS